MEENVNLLVKYVMTKDVLADKIKLQNMLQSEYYRESCNGKLYDSENEPEKLKNKEWKGWMR